MFFWLIYVDFSGLLYNDLWNNDTGVPCGAKIVVTLWPNDPALCIESYDSSPNYKIELTRIRLHVPVVTFDTSAFNHYQASLIK